MTNLWIYSDSNGEPDARPLPLPLRRIDKPIDPEIFRRQARGEVMPAPPLQPADELRTRHTAEARRELGRVWDGRGLVFVLSGKVELSTSSGAQTLSAGDLYFQDDFAGKSHVAVCGADCRLLHLRVPDSWAPYGEEFAAPVEAPGYARQPRWQRMYTANDNKSYFRGFEELFTASGQWGEPHPVNGFRMSVFPDSSFIDWHPEVVNNFVVVTSGQLQLEVSGDHAIQTFYPGDVCLAEDRTGEGHKNLTRGETCLAVIVMEDEALWPS